MPQRTRFYQELIGILRWAVELGQFDIHFEVSRMSFYMASPRIGHFEQVLHIFGYLQNVPKLTLAMDPLMPDISEDRFIEADWHDFYRDAKEEIPPNLPVPKGKPVTISCFVDASHACDIVTCHSQTGILIFLNQAPIHWYSKKNVLLKDLPLVVNILQ